MSYKKSIIEREEEHVDRIRQSYVQKYPVVFTLAGTFGFVATLYGFEKLIDKVDLFVNNPWILLATGLAILFATGAFYNKLR